MNTKHTTTASSKIEPVKGFSCQNVHFTWKDSEQPVDVLKDVSLQIHSGEFVSIIGPSGCGKTTLLNILGGVSKPDSGTVYLDGQILGSSKQGVTAPTTSDVGVIVQDYGLLPWLTVRGNVAFGMKMSGIPKNEQKNAIIELLSKVGLLDFANHYPHQLSGGMKQRTSIARALANQSQYLLMDEPFSALDFQTRLMMQEFLTDIWQQFKKTIVFITHHVEEAILLSDKIYLLSARPGTVLEEVTIDLPRPRNVADAKFNEYRNHITSYLQKEVLKSFEEQNAIPLG